MCNKIIKRHQLPSNKIQLYNRIIMQSIQDFIKMKIKQLQANQMMNKAFFEPMQITLKTHKTSGPQFENVNGEKQDQIKVGQLPKGLKIVNKRSFSQNKYESLESFKPIDFHKSNLSKSQCNLLSILKSGSSKQGKFQVAFCVCMYNQTKQMLKNTLRGIERNIDQLIKNGVSQDSIAVFVIIDGIQTIDPSILDYYEQLQRQHSTSLIDQIPIDQPYQNLFELIKNQYCAHRLLYSPLQLEERIKRRYNQCRNQYLHFKILLKTINSYGNKDIYYDNYDQKIKEVFLELIHQDGKTVKDSDILLEFNHNSIYKAIMIRAINRVKKQCEQYLSARSELAYLSCLRINIGEQEAKEQEWENLLNKNEYSLDNNGNQTPLRSEKSKQLLKADKEEKSLGLNENSPLKKKSSMQMNLFLCTKYQNRGKLSSHNWFFNGFCKQLQPNYIFLIDVGLRAQKEALYKMYKTMKNDNNIGGVCGFMRLKVQKAQQQEEVQTLDCISGILGYLFDIQKAQQMEYNFAHIIDKPFESWFKFIHVLPGAFSGYNFRMIEENKGQQTNILKEYFKSLEINQSDIIYQPLTFCDIICRLFAPSFCLKAPPPNSAEQLLYNSNIFQAEDRILSMGIYEKNLTMVYIPDSYATVDPVHIFHKVFGQRKRWINGSYFAFQKVRRQLHPTACLSFQLMFLTFTEILASLSPSIFFFTLAIATQIFIDEIHPLFSALIPERDSPFLLLIAYIVNFSYVIFIGSIAFKCIYFNNNDKNLYPSLYAFSNFIGIMSIFIFIFLVIGLVQGLLKNQNGFTDSGFGYQVVIGFIIVLITLVGLYTVAVITFCFLFSKWCLLREIITCSLSFIYYSSAYLIVIPIYALSRIDDLSWGTKGLNKKENTNKNIENQWFIIKLIYLAKHLLWNLIFGVFLYASSQVSYLRFIVTFIIVGLLILITSIKIIFSWFYFCSFQYNSVSNSAECKYESSQIQLFIPNKAFDIQDYFIEHIQAETRKQIKKRVQNQVQFISRNFNPQNGLMHYRQMLKEKEQYELVQGIKLKNTLESQYRNKKKIVFQGTMKSNPKRKLQSLRKNRK